MPNKIYELVKEIATGTFIEFDQDGPDTCRYCGFLAESGDHSDNCEFKMATELYYDDELFLKESVNLITDLVFPVVNAEKI